MCAQGYVAKTSTDACGCETRTCVACGDCPSYGTPGPDFCKGGTIVAGDVDACGCSGPPKCVK